MFFSSFSLFDLQKGGNFKIIFSLFRTLSYITLVHKKTKYVVNCDIAPYISFRNYGLFIRYTTIKHLQTNATALQFTHIIAVFCCCPDTKQRGLELTKIDIWGIHIICPQNLRINTFRFQKWDWLYVVLIYTDKRPKLEGYLTPHYRCVVSKIE